MRALLRALSILLPPVLFILWILHLRGEFDAATGGREILIVVAKGLVALMLAVLLLAIAIRRWVLPAFGQKISDALYAGTYLPGDDALVVLAERVAHSADPSLLPELESLVKADAGRMRGWQELSRIQLEVFQNPRQAYETLLMGAAHVSDGQDKAMLLYRAGKLAETHLHDVEASRSCYKQAAERFPLTVYGKEAARKLQD